MKPFPCLIAVLLPLAPATAPAQLVMGISLDVTASSNLAAYDTLPDGVIVRTGNNGADDWNQATAAAAGVAVFPDLVLADGTQTSASLTIGRRNATNLGRSLRHHRQAGRHR
jgi:hypothetical protein